MLQLSRKHSFDEVFDSQSVFRLVLEAMSNPSRVVSVKAYSDKLYGEHPAMLALGLTLLDNEVSFHSCENHALSDEIVSLTLARRAGLALADFVFVCSSADLPEVLKNVKCGTLSDPHKSVTVVIQDDGSPICEMLLYGPGIDGRIAVMVSETVKTALQLREEQCYEYPQGIDLLFVTGSGELFALPRLVCWEVR